MEAADLKKWGKILSQLLYWSIGQGFSWNIGSVWLQSNIIMAAIIGPIQDQFTVTEAYWQDLSVEVISRTTGSCQEPSLPVACDHEKDLEMVLGSTLWALEMN